MNITCEDRLIVLLYTINLRIFFKVFVETKLNLKSQKRKLDMSIYVDSLIFISLEREYSNVTVEKGSWI